MQRRRRLAIAARRPAPYGAQGRPEHRHEDAPEPGRADVLTDVKKVAQSAPAGAGRQRPEDQDKNVKQNHRSECDRNATSGARLGMLSWWFPVDAQCGNLCCVFATLVFGALSSSSCTERSAGHHDLTSRAHPPRPGSGDPVAVVEVCFARPLGLPHAHGTAAPRQKRTHSQGQRCSLAHEHMSRMRCTVLGPCHRSCPTRR